METMRQVTTRRLAGAMIAAAGWVALWLVCRDLLPVAGQGVVLYTLLMAEVASAAILAGAGRGTEPGWLPGERGAGQLITGWAIFLALLVLLAATGRLAIYVHHLSGIALLGGLTGLLTAAKARGRAAGGRGIAALLVAARGLVFAGLLAAGAQLVLPTWQGALGVICLATLLLLLPPVRTGAQAPPANIPPRGIARQLDVLLVGLLLSPRMALAYLLARGMTRAVTLTLDHLMAVAGSPAGTRGDIRLPRIAADAARLNLGLLLVGGAAGLGVLSLAGPAMTLWPDLGLARGAVLHWLLLAAAVPAIFGAAPVLMRAGGMAREHGLVAATTAGVTLLAALALAPRSAAELACLVAVAELGTAATCAVILGVRAGVWPGLTALLFRGIRLF